MEPLKLHEVKHPHKDYNGRYEKLIGLDTQKRLLLANLRLLFEQESDLAWKKKFHPKGLNVLDSILRATPLILLSGDVGCGKTELASCIGTPLSNVLGGKTVRVFETPSDTRGGGLVGELSARITTAFRSATSALKPNEKGILVIDEADDLAADRQQEHAHHEDRAGVNALIKEVDRLEKQKTPLVVVLITNRETVMDAAIRRRAVAEIQFRRPNAEEIDEVIEYLLKDVESTPAQIKAITSLCTKNKPLHSYSDFFTRITRQAIIIAQNNYVAYSPDVLKQAIENTKPSPQILQP